MTAHAQTSANMDPLGVQLRWVNGQRPLPAALPPADLIAPYDQQLAGLVSAASAAESDARQAAQYWQRCQPPGGSVYREAVAAELAACTEWLTQHDGQLPPAPASNHPGALVDHLANAMPASFVAALRAEHRADWTASQARQAALKAEGLRKQLDTETDLLRDQIAEHLEAARDHRDHAAHDEALRLAKQWTTLARLFRWTRDPAQPWRSDVTGRIPAELEYLEWQCRGVLDGREPAEVPIDPPTYLTGDQLARWWPQVRTRRTGILGRSR